MSTEVKEHRIVIARNEDPCAKRRHRWVWSVETKFGSEWSPWESGKAATLEDADRKARRKVFFGLEKEHRREIHILSQRDKSTYKPRTAATVPARFVK